MASTRNTDLDAELEWTLYGDPALDEVTYPTEYCDLCEREGHTFRFCPTRDDEYGDDI